MSGHNHYADCTCGWCLKFGGRRRSSVLYSSADAGAFRTYESFTIPNASCPVCGALVFFYQSPHGGRVFFDELGPPWMKHPCTDHGAPVTRPAAARMRKLRHPTWLGEGWTPVIVQNSRMSGQWHVVPVEILAHRVHIEVLSAEPVRPPPHRCAFMREFDVGGLGELSILDLARRAEPNRFLIYEKKAFTSVSPFAASRSRNRKAGG